MEHQLIQRVRRSEEGVRRDGQALARYLEHARLVRVLEIEIKRRGRPVKRTFAERELDYQLARQCVRIAATVARHKDAHPAIAMLGPSFVHLAHEVERRFERERRGDDFAAFLADLLAGMPRSKLREKWLPAHAQPGAARLLALVKAGRMEPARRLWETLDAAERAELMLLSRGLGLIAVEPAAESIDHALRGYLGKGAA